VDCLKTEKQYKTLEDEMKYLENKLNITIGDKEDLRRLSG
jgi:hypothetical protein